MESRSLLIKTKEHNLLHNCRNIFRRSWVQDWRESRAHYSNLGGYVEGVCDRFQRELGLSPSSYRVLIQ